MAKTYTNLQQQIAKLQKEAEALKAKEIAGVIERIREAIKHYGITPKEIFGSSPKRGRPAGKGTKAKKEMSIAKYRDETGNTWSGRGPRPHWFKAALEAGKSTDELLVKG